MPLCAIQCDSTCFARQRKGKGIDRSRHIRAGAKMNLLHYEEEATEPEASARIMDSRNRLFQSPSVFSLCMLHQAADDYSSEGDGTNLSH